MYRRLHSVAFVLLCWPALFGADSGNSENQSADWKQEASELRRLIQELSHRIQELSDRIETLDQHVARDENRSGTERMVRYEQVHVRFADFASRDAAYKSISARGNDVLGGKAIDKPWKLFGWTPRSQIESVVIRKAAFTLPLGRLSQIIEDKNGLYILRVLERRE